MSNGARTDCIHEKGGASLKEFGHVFLASEATPSSWVKLLDEKTVVFEWVQVHTTGLV